MIVVPAIDVIDGQCVRLEQGNFDKITLYHKEPLEVAKKFEDAGLKRLHLVDLDGAKARAVKNWKVLEAIALGALIFAGGLPALAEGDASSLLTDLDAQYDKAWNTHDAQKLADLFAVDAIVLSPARHATIGKQAVLTSFEQLFKDKWSEHRLEPVIAQQTVDNMLVAVSRWSATLTDTSGKSTRVKLCVPAASEVWMKKPL